MVIGELPDEAICSKLILLCKWILHLFHQVTLHLFHPSQSAAPCLCKQAEPDAEPVEVPERRYEGRSSAGAPAPLAPSLVTLSLLPRTQASASCCLALALCSAMCKSLVVTQLLLATASHRLCGRVLFCWTHCICDQSRCLCLCVQWHNLVHLDAIKARSKPVQPPKKPEAAPFFLPTLAGALK